MIDEGFERRAGCCCHLEKTRVVDRLSLTWVGPAARAWVWIFDGGFVEE